MPFSAVVRFPVIDQYKSRLGQPRDGRPVWGASPYHPRCSQTRYRATPTVYYSCNATHPLYILQRLLYLYLTGSSNPCSVDKLRLRRRLGLLLHTPAPLCSTHQPHCGLHTSPTVVYTPASLWSTHQPHCGIHTSLTVVYTPALLWYTHQPHCDIHTSPTVVYTPAPLWSIYQPHCGLHTSPL